MLDNTIVRYAIILVLALLFIWFVLRFIYDWEKDHKERIRVERKRRDRSKFDERANQMSSAQRTTAVPRHAPKSPVTPMRPDDLTQIEGIGPKVQELLNKEDIRTFRRLATTEVSDIKHILARAGEQFRMYDPSTWPRQAKLAANGQWEDLAKLQRRLHSGRPS